MYEVVQRDGVIVSSHQTMWQAVEWCWAKWPSGAPAGAYIRHEAWGRLSIPVR